MNGLYEKYTRNHASLIGQKFGRLTVCDIDEWGGKKKVKWICLCDCSVFVSVRGETLLNGRTRSCGCLLRKSTATRMTAHGATVGVTRTREFASWINMRSRCNNPNSTGWKRYGKRGIKVCERWNHSFVNFLSDMGPCPEGQEIDRNDNDGDYEPSNCKWSTRKEQMGHTSRSRSVTIAGITKTLSVWCEEHDVSMSNLRHRLKFNWPEHELLQPPNRKRKKHR